MGIFSKESLALSALFAGAPRAEVDRVNATLIRQAEDQGYDITPPRAEVDRVNDALREVAVSQGTGPDTVVVDDVQYRPNRKARREYSRSLRNRTRVTGISKRSERISPRRLHADANNKVLHFINHGLLHSVFARANIWKGQA